MIRSLILAAGFLVVTIVLLLMQPGNRDVGPSLTEFELEPVTRADNSPTVPLTLTEPASQTFVSASTTATTQTSQMTSSPTARLRPVFTSDAAPAPQSVTPSDPVATATRSAQPSLSKLENFLPDDGDAVQSKVAMMTRNIMREFSASGGTPTAPQANAPALVTPRAELQQTSPTVEDTLTRANLAGQSDYELEQIVRGAVASGEIVPDSAFATALGDVDYRALVAAYIPSRESAPVSPIRQDFFYRVQPGDSLAGLSMLFYGDALDYNRIQTTNTAVLGPTGTIAAGMLLNIPAAP